MNQLPPVSPRPRAPSLRALVALVAGLVAPTSAFAACGVTTPSTAAAGSTSSAALQANDGFVRTDGSFSCTTSPLATLLAGDYLRATLATGTAMTLTGTGGSVTVVLAADQAGAKRLTPGTTVSYQEGALLTLLDNSSMRPPIFVNARSSGDLPAGTYSGVFPIRWDWSFCTQAGVLGACAVGKTDTGSKVAQVTVTLIVVPKPASVVVAYKTTWSPTSSTVNPKAVPGAKVRVAATITNPDVVALDANTMAVMMATPPAMRLALEGDGTATNGSVETVQGSKASGLTLSYVSPGSAADDVDFSADNGATWTYAPVAGDAVSQAAVTTVRFRPQGRMAAGSSFAISLPYAVK